MSITGKSSQAKGRRAELQLVKLLQDSGYKDVALGPPMSFGTAPDILNLRGIHPEVKAVEKLNLPAALRQAEEDSQTFGDGLPVVFRKYRRQGWVASMALTDWLQMYSKFIK